MPTIQPAVEPVRPDTGRPVSPEAAALAAAGLAAAALAANRFVVRRRRSAPVPNEPESDVHVENGFADADPVEDLARRLARSSDPAAAIASLLGQAYTAIFDEQLQLEERREASTGVTVAATRHGRTSTTLVLAAPVAARPYLCNNMRAAAERAFGEQVDVDGLVGQDGDVLVRVTWHPRRPIDGQLLERVNAGIPERLAGAVPGASARPVRSTVHVDQLAYRAQRPGGRANRPGRRGPVERHWSRHWRAGARLRISGWSWWRGRTRCPTRSASFPTVCSTSSIPPVLRRSSKHSRV